MKSNLQGRRDDRKGGFSPPLNTAKQSAGGRPLVATPNGICQLQDRQNRCNLLR